MVGASALVAVACSGPGLSPGPCGKDTDCKGTRVCVAGSCVDRGPAPVVTGPTVTGDGGVEVVDARGPVIGPRPFAMLGGDGRHQGRAGGPAPTRAPRQVWQVALAGPVTGGPTLGPDGTLYVADHGGQLTAVAPDGAVRWTARLGERSWSTPALAVDGTVYVGSDDDRLRAFDGATGAERWALRIGACAPGSFGPESSRCDADGGPVIGDDGTIYVGGDGVTAAWADGTLRWRFATAEHVHAAPALADGTIYVASEDDALYALSPDGDKRWEVRTGGDLDATPVVGDDGTIYVGSDDDALYAVSPAGEIRWKLLTGGDIRGGVAIAADGTLYVTSYDGNLYAVAPSGQVRWRLATPQKIHARPVVATNGYVLFGAQDDRLYAARPDGALAWTFGLGGDLDAAITLGADGTIYVAGDDAVLRALR